MVWIMEKKIYFAPLEGITGYLYRGLHKKLFGDSVDKYFTPFVSPTSSFNFKSREKKDILPENNIGVPVVPQILTNHEEDFLYTARCLRDYGYEEINLNLGCPSGTVAPKGRGAGFLAKPMELDIFLENIYNRFEGKISIKTRIGMNSPDEFENILQIYNKYPVSELTIHPRIRQDFYKNTPNLSVFSKAVLDSRAPLCYNGDVCDENDYERIVEKFPTVDAIMIGRGLIANPGLARQIKTGQKMTWEEALNFGMLLTEEYEKVMSPKPVLFKMKEVWSYMCQCHPNKELLWKKIRKTKSLDEYKAVLLENR